MKDLNPDQSKALIETLKTRFEGNMPRHKGMQWQKVSAKLTSAPDKLWSVSVCYDPEALASRKKHKRRFDTVFVYHNGVESYYGGRGFRCSIRM